MALFDSEISIFQITDTGAQLRDISANVVSIAGLPGVRQLNDVTALGDGGTKWNPSLENVVIRLGLLWSDDANVGSDTVLGPLRTHGSEVAFDYGPEGKGSGDIKYSGNAFVRNFEIVSQAGDTVKATCELQVNGKVARGTYSA